MLEHSLDSLNNVAGTVASTFSDKNLTVFGMPIQLASVIIPLVIFIAGILVNRFFENCRRRKEVETYRDSILSWCELIGIVVPNQVHSLQNLSDKIQSSDDFRPEAYIITGCYANMLKDISAEKVISMFVLNSMPKDGNFQKCQKYSFDLVSMIGYLSSVDNTILSRYNSYVKEMNDLSEEYNAILGRVVDSINSLHKEGEEGKLYVALNKMYNNPNSGRYDTFEEVYKNVITPLYDEVEAYFYKYTDKELRVTRIFDSLSHIRFLYKQFEISKKIHAENFSFESNTLENANKSLSNCVSYFKEKTKVRRWLL